MKASEVSGGCIFDDMIRKTDPSDGFSLPRFRDTRTLLNINAFKVFALPFTFVHTADLHLDSPLKALALREPDLAEIVGTATRTALTRIVDLCITEQVDALLIAGDLWDGRYSTTRTPRFLKVELNRLDEAQIRCFIIRGNHDAESKLNNELDAPANTMVFSERLKTQAFRAGDMDIAVHGLSMPTPQVKDSLLPKYPPPVPGAFNIGMMHTSLDGSSRHDPYAPCALSDLDAFGYGYWALGHIHKRAEYHGAATVVMPGIPQGRDIGEAGETSVSLVSVSEDGKVRVETRSVAAARFDRLPVDVSGIDDWSGIVAALSRALRSVCVDVDTLILRPVLTGRTSLRWRLSRDRDRLAEEARAIAESIEGLWIDKIELDLEESGPQPDIQLPDDLIALVKGGLASDPALMQAVNEAANELLADMPADMRMFLGDSPEAAERCCSDLLQEGATDLLMRLSARPEVD